MSIQVAMRNMGLIALLFTGVVGQACADDLSLEPNANHVFSMLLWGCVVLGVVAGYTYRQYLHSRLKSHENLKGGIVAVLAALVLAFLPYMVGGYGQFSRSCLTSLTDDTGMVRQEVVLAEECVIAREEVSGLGVKPVISAYKSSFGYSRNDQHLSTSGVIFFYGLMLVIWTIITYSLLISVKKFMR
jgi:hypothetical protein